MSEPESIGGASMDADGTITLRLRAEGPAGMIGEAALVYRPSDKDYGAILDHLGGLQPGQEKLVPPFPDDDQDDPPTPGQVRRERSMGSVLGLVLLVPAALLWLVVLVGAFGAMSGADAETAGVIVGRLAFPWIVAAIVQFGWVKLVRKDGRIFFSAWTVVIAAVVYLLMVAGAAS